MENQETTDTSLPYAELSDIENLTYFFEKYKFSVERGKPNQRLAEQLKTYIDIIQVRGVTYDIILDDILKNHNKYSNDELDSKLKEYYKSIPYDVDVFSPRLNEIIMNRFPEGVHWKRFKIPVGNITLPQPPKSRIDREPSWLETLTFGLYKTKSYHKRNE
jgi:hypothetical protein